MIRMLLVGYCFAIHSERRLCEEVHLNLAYHWFCGAGLDDKVPDHSTFSLNCIGHAITIWKDLSNPLALDQCAKLLNYADRETLQEFASALSPRVVVPIHTKEPGRYVELFDDVQQLNDEEWCDL